jgi:hypothetical protein
VIVLAIRSSMRSTSQRSSSLSLGHGRIDDTAASVAWSRDRSGTRNGWTTRDTTGIRRQLEQPDAEQVRRARCFLAATPSSCRARGIRGPQAGRY